MRSLTTILLLVAAIAVAGGLVFAFRQGRNEAAAEAERDKPIKAPTRVQVVKGQNIVRFDPATLAGSGIAVEPPQTASTRQQFPAYGVVLDLQDLIDLGNTLETGAAQLGKAESAREAAKQDYERARALFGKNQNVSEKTLQAAEATWHGEEANVQIAQAAIDAARATALQHWGSVIAAWLMRGDEKLAQLRARNTVLVQVTPAPDATIGTPPLAAQLQSPDGHLIDGQLVSPAPRTDPKIQGRSFFYIASAQDDLLPGMNVTAVLPIGQTVSGVVVPTSAVVWYQGKAWAYVRIKPDQFVRREVATDLPLRGGWLQADAFSAGEPLVNQGAQVLLSEEFRSEISVLGDEN